MSTISLLVETADLRRALRAVGPFVEKDAEPGSPLSTIRVTSDPVVTYVAATNGAAGALALVSTSALVIDGEAIDPGAGRWSVFDLSAGDAAKILTCFPGRDGKDGEPGDELRLEVDDEHLTVVDASGLFEGQSLILGRAPAAEHPANTLRTFSWLTSSEPTPPGDATVIAYGPSLALVIGASKVYDRNIVLELHTHGDRVTTLARIGESFLAAITEAYVDDEKSVAYREYRDAWRDRLAHRGDRRGDDLDPTGRR